VAREFGARRIRIIVTPDGTLRPDLDSTRAESGGTGLNNNEGNGIGAQIAALPDAVLPVVVSPPPAGERVEVDLDMTPVVRLAVDLAGAQVDVADGRSSSRWQMAASLFLKAMSFSSFSLGDAAIDQFLTAAAGNQDATEIAGRRDIGSSFQRGGPVPTLASLFDAAARSPGRTLLWSGGYGADCPRSGASGG
jgi:hypothetical protein